MEELKVIDFSAVDEIVDKVSEGGYSFSEYVNMFAQGENSLNYRGITDSVIDIARNEVLDVKKILTEMLFVVVAAAIFVNLSKIFKSRQVSESGFYITYMLMFVLMASYAGACSDIFSYCILCVWGNSFRIFLSGVAYAYNFSGSNARKCISAIN